jgi:hypothetical protein
MLNHDPEGYRKLLAYQKACELQIFTNNFVLNLPKTKTFFDLADQMSRSGRSGSKNIVEGWKRNTTKEYFTFLGFSIGAVEELKDDAADIVTGVYPQLIGVKGITGKKREEREEKEILSHHFHPSDPLTPLYPLPMDRHQLDKIPFYPLPPLLPPAVELFLRAKEVNFLLFRLQKSLDLKMDKEFTKPLNEKIGSRFMEEKKVDDDFQKYLASLGMQRLPNGKYVSKGEKGDERE